MNLLERLFNSGVIQVSTTGAPVSLASFDKPFMILAMLGIIITALAMHKRIPGGLAGYNFYYNLCR